MPLSNRTGKLAARGLPNPRQRVERADRPVDLAPAVVGDDQPVYACLQRAARVVSVEDALERDRQRCLLAQPRQVGPRHPRVGELVCPMADRRAGVLLGGPLERRAEHGVAEVVGHALAFQERQIAVLQVARAPAEQPGVERDHDRRVAGVAGAGDEAGGELPIPGPVQLIPAARRPDRVGHLLHRVRRGRAEDERQTNRRRRPADRQLALGVYDRLHADRREHHRRGHRRAEHRGARIAL